MKTIITRLFFCVSAFGFISVPALANPKLTIATETTSRTYSFSDNQLSIALNKGKYRFTFSDYDNKSSCISSNYQRLRFNKALSLSCDTRSHFTGKIFSSGHYLFSLVQGKVRVSKTSSGKTAKEYKRPLPDIKCSLYAGGKISVDVGNTFKDGEWVTDAYSGQKAQVRDHQISMTPDKNSGGLLLLESVSPQKASFNWRNAQIYFVMLDRFNNADTDNDHSYGRRSDGKNEVGTFHGGDLKGVTEKLDYIQSLGANVIWLSPIVQQVAGFVGGGEKGGFPFYAYHGYWAKDFTQIDANFGTEADLKELVTQAHQRGIKILLDIVINHAGYATLADIQEAFPGVVKPDASWPTRWNNWQPEENQNWHSFNKQIDYRSPLWAKKWWTGDWVRAGLPGYPVPGSDDLTMTLAGLPDFRTESAKEVKIPDYLANNPGTKARTLAHFSVRDYLIKWQADWVKRFGIDGFRVDTAKHVQGSVFKELKKKSQVALNAWRKVNHSADKTPFWMMAEVWGHGPEHGPYYRDGFDAVINFDLQGGIDDGAYCLSYMDKLYQRYSNILSEDPLVQPVSYISSHDTELYFNRYRSMFMQKGVATAFLFMPGGIQTYYGDEIARPHGPYADDFHQGTRSDMLWTLDPKRKSLLLHWRKLGHFRAQHPAIGAGIHQNLPQKQGYAFSRILGQDRVIIAFAGQVKGK